MNAPVTKLKTAEATPIEVASITAPHVLQAINAVMAEVAVEGISKSRNNAQQGYKFRGIDDVYNALAPILARNHLVITPKCLKREKEVVSTARGGTLFYVTVDMEFELASSIDGTTKTAQMFGEAMDSGDKATNKAMSAAYKYMAMQEFCIPTEGDNDADAVTHELAPRQQAQAPTQAQPRNVAKGAEAPKTPTLAERADRLEAAMRAQDSEEGLRKAYALASGLCAALDDKDPERLAEIEQIYGALLSKFTPPPADDFGIGDDEIPF